MTQVNLKWNAKSSLLIRNLLTEKIKNPAFIMPDGTPVYINKFGRWFVEFDPEVELVAMLSEEIARSIDREILNVLIELG